MPRANNAAPASGMDKVTQCSAWDDPYKDGQELDDTKTETGR